MSDDPRPCPRCGSALTVREGSSSRLLVCGTCGGLFAYGVRPDGVGGTLEGRALEEATAAASAAMLLRDETAAVVACPECRRQLSRYRIEETDVELDACEPHGVWFDRDELPKLARFGQAGARLKVAVVTGRSGGAATAVAVASAGAAGIAVASAVATSSGSTGGGMGSALAEAAGEAAVDLVLEGLGELISGIFS